MSNYIFKKGDIIKLDFDPIRETKIKGTYYALVLSNDIFNKSSLALVAPITQGSYHHDGGFTTSLMSAGTETEGVIVVNASKIIDLRVRKAKLKEKCPADILEEVNAKFEAIL